MAFWRPPQTNTERLFRSIRSMQNGSLDGRVISAYPVKQGGEDSPYFGDYEDSIEDDIVDGGEEGGEEVEVEDEPSLRPWTDTFIVDAVKSAHSYNLSRVPWEQPDMAPVEQIYSSVHLYWNGVFQPDMVYDLRGFVLTIADPDLLIRPGDTVTVKYFYDLDMDMSTVSADTFRMLCWMDWYETQQPNLPGYYIGYNGTLSAPPTGMNAGNITTAGTYYTDLQSTGTWNSKFRLPIGQRIPIDDSDVTGVTWTISFDERADCRIRHPYLEQDFDWKGFDYGEVLCRKSECGLATATACHQHLPLLLSDVVDAGDLHAYGPLGGHVFCEGEAGINLARLMNIYAAKGDINDGVGVSRAMPEYEDRVPGNDGCSYGGGEWGNAENTLYGRWHHSAATYSITIGVTATVQRGG